MLLCQGRRASSPLFPSVTSLETESLHPSRFHLLLKLLSLTLSSLCHLIWNHLKSLQWLTYMLRSNLQDLVDTVSGWHCNWSSDKNISSRISEYVLPTDLCFKNRPEIAEILPIYQSRKHVIPELSPDLDIEDITCAVINWTKEDCKAEIKEHQDTMLSEV